MSLARIGAADAVALIDRPGAAQILVFQCSNAAAETVRRALDRRALGPRPAVCRGPGRRPAGALFSRLTLTARDNDAAAFVDRLCAALALPSSSLEEPAGEEQALARLSILLNRLAGEGKERTLLLDRYELLAGAAVRRFVGYLLDNLPQNTRCAVITEGALPPGLPRLLVRARAELFSCVQ